MSTTVGWMLITAGFITGSIFGWQAQRNEWCGGYEARPRRLLRLGHIALIALGALNVAWPMTPTFQSRGALVPWISTCFIIGGLTMGPGCFLTAWRWPWRAVLVVPSTALIVGGLLATATSLGMY